MKVTFLGATRTVTGSKYLLEDEGKKILIDCGLFQGLKDLRNRNWEPFPIAASDIDSIILTHAHIDHSGYIPVLIKKGFRGEIFCTPGTYDLCKILLPDSGHLQEEDAEKANRYGYSKHQPALPLYTEEDAKKSLEYFKPLAFGKEHVLGDFLKFRFTHAGHILGAASITITDGLTTIVFSGDLGRPVDPVMKEPAKIQEADFLILESTYGNRRHPSEDPLDQLANVVTTTVSRGGTVVIPAFAVGRAQTLIYCFYELRKRGRIANVPIYLDSPMAINATRLLQKYNSEHRLSEKICADACAGVIYTASVEQSKEIYSKNNGMPAIIISASGMATGGRVLHHLKHYLGDSRNTVLLAGFQAAGTRGAQLLSGEKSIKIHGLDYRVEAQIALLDSLSAHADYHEMLEWLRNFRKPPRATYLVHGEIEASIAFKEKIEKELGWNVYIPDYKEVHEF